MPIKFVAPPPPPDCSFFSPLLPLLSSAAFLCVFRKSDTPLTKLVRDCVGGNPWSVFDRAEIPADCSHAVFLDAAAEEILEAAEGTPGLSWEKHLIILNWETPLDLRKLEANSDRFRSSAVSARYGDKTLALGSPLFTPRALAEYSNGSFADNEDLRGRQISGFWLDRNIIERPKYGFELTELYKSLGKPYVYLTTSGALGNVFEDLTQHLNITHVSNQYHVLYWYDIGDKTSLSLPPNWFKIILEQWDSRDVSLGFHLSDDLVARNWRDVGPVLTDLKFTYLVRRPASSPPTVWRVLGAYTPPVWILLGASFAIVAAAYRTMETLAGRRRSASDTFFAVLAPLLLAGDSPPRSPASHVLVGWSIFAFFSAVVFTSDFLDRVTLPVVAPRVDTEADAEDGGYMSIRDYFAHRDSSIAFGAEELTDEIISNGKVLLRATVHGSTVIEHALSHYSDAAEYRAMKDAVDFTDFSVVAVRRESPLYPVINAGFQRLLETGAWHYNVKRALREGLTREIRQLQVEEDRPAYEYGPLTPTQMMPAVYVLATTTCLSLLALAVEIVHANRDWIRGKIVGFFRLLAFAAFVLENILFSALDDLVLFYERYLRR